MDTIKRNAVRALFALLIAFAIVWGLLPADDSTATLGTVPNDMTIVEIARQPVITQTKRLGINVGQPDQYGSPMMKNLIPNPGLESADIATIFLTSDASDGNTLQADWESHIAMDHPVGLWDGTQFEIVTGEATGRWGEVGFGSHDDQRFTLNLDDNGVAPGKEDVVMVRGRLVGNFWHNGDRRWMEVDINDKRPGTRGEQSVLLHPNQQYGTSLNYYFDSTARDSDPSAGKLIKVEGQWEFRFWAKSARPTQDVRVSFHRLSGEQFLDKTITLNSWWNEYTVSFYADPDADPLPGDPQPLELGLYISPEDGGDVWVDDLWFGRTDDYNPTAFNQQFVNKLRELNPGILRNWGNQFGSSLPNQLARPYERRTSAYNPRHKEPNLYHYSLHEFLVLSQQVNAEPWYVIPPHFSFTELQNLIAYLSAPVGEHPYAQIRANNGQWQPWTDIFPEIHLEFGNEMWGWNDGSDQFIGATVRGGTRLGVLAHARMDIMKNSQFFDGDKINFIIGGQANVPGRQWEIEQFSFNHQTVALSPYFSYEITADRNDLIYYPMFADGYYSATSGPMAESKRWLEEMGSPDTEMAIYEISLHTTEGDASLDLRNDVVTSQGAGLAMSLHMLTYMKELGVTNQTAFTALQYSHLLPDQSGNVQLWGMLRDLHVTGRKRPTWLGVELANQAIGGNMLETTHSGYTPSWWSGQVELPMLHSFAFSYGAQDYAIVLFNLNLANEQTVALDFPEAINKQGKMYTMTADNIRADNETAEDVTITERTVGISPYTTLTLPPHSMVVITTR